MENVKVKSKNRNLNPIILVVFTILILYALSVFFMLIWGFITSFKSYYEFTLGFDRLGGRNVLGLPDIAYNLRIYEFFGEQYSFFGNYTSIIQKFGYTLEAQPYYSAIWGSMLIEKSTFGFLDYVFNSVFYALFGALCYSMVCLVSAYLCAKYKYKFSYFLYTMLLVIMTIPLVGTQPAVIKLLRDMGIYSTYTGMFIMSFNFSGLYFFVYFAFFQGLSETFAEAAEIDGASQLMILLRVIIPLSAKLFGTVFLIQFIALWNNYEVPLLYFPSKPTLAYAIWKLNNPSNHAGDITEQGDAQKIAGCMLLALPVLILFLCLKNVIMGNISLGGLKE